MQRIIRAVDGLEIGELKAHLQMFAAYAERLKEQKPPSDDDLAKLVELYDALMMDRSVRNHWAPTPACTHVHLVVGDSFAGGMKHTLKELGWEEHHKVVALRENYAIGPLADLDSPDGRKARSDWFCEHIAEAVEAYSQFEDEYRELLTMVERIPSHADIVVWADDNACEQTGMRHALHLLRHKPNRVALYDACAICERLYNRPRASISYVHSGEIPPDKLREALKRMDGSGALQTEDLARLRREWQAISEQAEALRVWRDGAVVEVSADYYDDYLLSKLDALKPPAGSNGFLRAARVIGEALGYCEQYVGDSFFEYRLRSLILDGVLEIKGVPAAMRHYSVRRKRPAPN